MVVGAVALKQSLWGANTHFIYYMLQCCLFRLIYEWCRQLSALFMKWLWLLQTCWHWPAVNLVTLPVHSSLPFPPPFISLPSTSLSRVIDCCVGLKRVFIDCAQVRWVWNSGAGLFVSSLRLDLGVNRLGYTTLFWQTDFVPMKLFWSNVIGNPTTSHIPKTLTVALSYVGIVSPSQSSDLSSCWICLLLVFCM